MIFFRKGVRSVDKKGKEVMYDLEGPINQSVFPGHQVRGRWDLIQRQPARRDRIVGHRLLGRAVIGGSQRGCWSKL